MKFIVILSIGLSASSWFVAGLAEPLLDGAAYAQSLAPTTRTSGQLTNSNQHSEQALPREQKEVWNGEQNYFRYLQAKDLKSFMSLWDDNFIGWPDYSEHPLRKPDIESSVAEEVQATPTSTRPTPMPKPEAIAVFGDVAVTYYFWPEADETSPLKYRITHTWRKGPEGWRIISGMDCEVRRSSEVKTEVTRSSPSVATTAQESAARTCCRSSIADSSCRSSSSPSAINFVGACGSFLTNPGRSFFCVPSAAFLFGGSLDHFPLRIPGSSIPS